MMQLTPRDTQDLCDIIGSAASSGSKIEFQGGGTRAEFGGEREVQTVSLAALSGVIDYDPAELVLTVRPATLLADVETLVAAEGQMLAFEPWGNEGATIGGTVAAGVAGSRRVTAGSARDHLLGFKAVSGRGETFVAGAKVVKNVTGYDLPKLMAGSWGRIGAMTELTLKVLPAPRHSVTLFAQGLSPEAAHAAMAAALGSNADVSAAAHLARGLTLFRLSGFEPSVKARAAALPGILSGYCDAQQIEEQTAGAFWKEAMTGNALPGETRWRIHLPPRRASEFLAQLNETAADLGLDWAMDWGGARIWVAHLGSSTVVRDVAAALGGEATLISGTAEMRNAVPAFQPRSAGITALEQRVRCAFDPHGVFASTRFLEDARADQLSA
jgi:glycolate oxidase FAD binding subunit